MRLLNTISGEMRSFFDAEIPPYAILSHRWEEGEVSFAEYMVANAGTSPITTNSAGAGVEVSRIMQSQGYRKLLTFRQMACSRGYEWCWLDTVCIDKTSSAELSEAINAMFEWYRCADLCFVFLSDVAGLPDFTNSKWFSRGWTLQELLAPRIVEFFDQMWRPIGERGELRREISRVTGIGVGVFEKGPGREHGDGQRKEKVRLLRVFLASVAERMSWAANRVTSRAEDMAYCLLGLFRINMPLLYGEGRDRAFQRLQFEIMRETDDESIFAWMTNHGTSRANIIAPSPGAFLGSSTVTELVASDAAFHVLSFRKPYEITNQGLRMQVHLMRATVLLQIRARHSQAIRIDVDEECAAREPIDLDSDDHIDYKEWLIPIKCKMTHTSPAPLLLRVMQGEEDSIPDMMATRTFYRCGRPYSPTAAEWQQLIAYQSEPLQKIYLGLRETTRIRDLRNAMSEIL